MDDQLSLEDMLGTLDYRAKSTAEKFLENTRGDFMENIYLREVPTEEDYAEALKIGLLKYNVDNRLRYGWKLNEAITKPPKVNEVSERKKMLLLAQRNGISERTYLRRIKKGLTPYDAATKELGKPGRKKKTS